MLCGKARKGLPRCEVQRVTAPPGSLGTSLIPSTSWTHVPALFRQALVLTFI